jgi:hypothetical protein
MSEQDTFEPAVQPEEGVPSAKKKRTCLTCGLIGCSVVVGVVVVLVVVGIFLVRSWVSSAIDRFTEPSPVDLPQIVVTDAEWSALTGRLNAFEAAVKNRQPTEPLVLSERDVNVLIQRSASVEPGQPVGYVTVSGDTIRAQVSIPVEHAAQYLLVGDRAKGRYLNGSGTFHVRTEQGRLFVEVVDGEIGGKPAPDELMSALRDNNLAEGLERRPNAAKFIENVEQIEVKDGAVVITPKVSRVAEAPDPLLTEEAGQSP